MRREELIHNEHIKLAVFLKINQLRREQLNTLTYSHVVKVLFQFKWNQKLPETMNGAVNDIMTLNASDVVAALHTLAIIEGSKMNLDSIGTIIGGDVHD